MIAAYSAYFFESHYPKGLLFLYADRVPENSFMPLFQTRNTALREKYAKRHQRALSICQQPWQTF